MADSSRQRLRAVLLGCGSLGKAVLRALTRSDAPIELVGVLTAHHGRMVQRDGIDPSLALNLVGSEGFGEQGPSEFRQVLEVAEPTLIIDTIPQNIRTGEPSLGYIRSALDSGINVVTANKSAIVLGYRDFCHRASRTNSRFRFGATVLDGLPLFSTVEWLQGLRIESVRGVLNGTSSLVLESVQLGSTRSRGLARAQAQGIAEADAVLDLDGWDAAAKAALLANVWMGGALRVVDVVRGGCESIKDDHLREVASQLHYRLVCEVTMQDGALRASVAPIGLEPNDPFHSLRGGNGGITITATNGQTFTMLQQTHGLDDAAWGILQDCFAIARDPTR